MPRDRRNSRCSGGKSSPTTATAITLVKKDAAVEKNVAEPPSTSSFFPNGVSTESSATLPTTRSDMDGPAAHSRLRAKATVLLGLGAVLLGCGGPDPRPATWSYV